MEKDYYENLDVEEIYEHINSNVLNLNIIWNDYTILFPSDMTEEHLSILTKSASSFFVYIQFTIFIDIIMRISRLYDVVKMKEYYNLTLKTLIKKLPSSENQETKRILEEQLTNSEKTFEDFKKWRHKYIGHQDLDIALGNEKLPKLPFDKCQSMINEINDILTNVNTYLNKDFKRYDAVQSIGNASLLLNRLEFSTKYRKFSSIMEHIPVDILLKKYIGKEKAGKVTIYNLLNNFYENNLGS